MAVENVPVKLCMQEIVKLDLQTKALIQDIRECNGPLDLLSDLNAETREKIQALRAKIEDLERLAYEQDKETDKQTILSHVQSHKTQLASTQTSLRRAFLSSQMSLEKREKEELLTLDTEIRQRKQANNKEGLVKTASNITDSLMNLSRMMSTQVQHSENTMSTLVSSSKTITETHEEFKSQGGHITASRKLLTKYNRRELTDKLLIFLALVFFFATVLYIVKKRLFASAGEEQDQSMQYTPPLPA